MPPGFSSVISAVAVCGPVDNVVNIVETLAYHAKMRGMALFNAKMFSKSIWFFEYAIEVGLSLLKKTTVWS